MVEFSETQGTTLNRLEGTLIAYIQCKVEDDEPLQALGDWEVLRVRLDLIRH